MDGNRKNDYGEIWRSPGGIVFVADGLVEAIRTFPVTKNIEHCGATFRVSSLDNYGICPKCGIKIKLRGFSSDYELPSVFDAVLEWLMKPGAEEIFAKRKRVVIEDMDE